MYANYVVTTRMSLSISVYGIANVFEGELKRILVGKKRCSKMDHFIVNSNDMD